MNGARKPKDGLVAQAARIAIADFADAHAPVLSEGALEGICRLNAKFERRYEDLFRVENSLTRSLVSFQGNKHRAVYRWFKYKEAFSAGLVEHLLERYCLSRGDTGPWSETATATIGA